MNQLSERFQALVDRFKGLPPAQQLAIGGGAAVVAILLVTVLLLTGGSQEQAVDPSTSTSSPTTSSTTTTTTTIAETSTTTVAGPRWPLTGIEDVDADVEAPILIVKIDNTSKSRPQLGITEADMVIEVLVEGGVPRFLAFYQSMIPDEIGPVRSVREVDPKLISPFGALFANSGGQDFVIAAIRKVAVDVNWKSVDNAYYKDPNRPSLYDVMLKTDHVVGWGEVPPADSWLLFDSDVPEGEQAQEVSVKLSNIFEANYEFTDLGYVRSNGDSPHVDPDGDPVVASTVIVLFVNELTTGRTDSAGAPVPDYEVLGEGGAIVFRDGIAIPGTWQRGAQGRFFQFFDSDGNEIAMAPGNVWIELAPVGRTVTWQ